MTACATQKLKYVHISQVYALNRVIDLSDEARIAYLQEKIKAMNIEKM